MRGVAVVAVVMLALTASVSSAAGTGSGTSLRIAYWEDGSGGSPDSVWTLRCGPPRGTLPLPARACRKLAAGGAGLFAPTPPRMACTEIYGGPERARIVGTVRGQPVWATVSRTNGCEISRWERLSPWLLPPGGVR